MLCELPLCEAGVPSLRRDEASELGLLAAFLVSITTAMGGGSAGGYILSAVYLAIGLAGLVWWSILRRRKG
ncbi:hypothetical protein ITJ57_14925 [Plantibacter sp. VKM Ac-2880]|uniref:hypothetical protein n=1 Tax=Plantibacter sp. VKM Ac-2880 TaxID=2783827 RepID=UPI00188F4F81|nr:hypothetical protein [Plantibacter sp. VKM Ac-2880]MBF4570063.1 hypothetical protein [Plantibacter sp. VKM Ac-2880]